MVAIEGPTMTSRLTSTRGSINIQATSARFLCRGDRRTSLRGERSCSAARSLAASIMGCSAGIKLPPLDNWRNLALLKLLLEGLVQFGAVCCGLHLAGEDLLHPLVDKNVRLGWPEGPGRVPVIAL